MRAFFHWDVQGNNPAYAFANKLRESSHSLDVFYGQFIQFGLSILIAFSSTLKFSLCIP